MSQSPEDALSLARDRFKSVDAKRTAAVAELAALIAAAGGAPPEGAASARVRELEGLLPALEREWVESHAAFGHAMLDEFARDLGTLTYPPHNPEAARELRLMADNLRRACLAVLSDWPELQEEARQRLRVAPLDPGSLHG